MFQQNHRQSAGLMAFAAQVLCLREFDGNIRKEVCR